MVSCNFYRGHLRTEVGITILLIALMVNSAHAAVLEVNSNNGIGIQSIVYPSIQGAIDGATDGDLIMVTPGTYYENLNISNKINLTITGTEKTSVILKPSSVLNWDECGHTSLRKAAVRIVNSSDVVLQNMTMDYDLVKADSVFGVFGCDSTVTLNNNILKNMSVSDTSSGGYSDLGTYFKAPGFSDISRADITISDNTFIDMGRVGIVTHDYINATITGNTFYKTTDDFGYAMEIGSQSTGVVRNNVIYGYDTPAASDKSESAGIYIENAFTGSSPSTFKRVVVENNEIYDSQLAMWIGNGYHGYAGDVDINVLLNNNNFHDNWQAGIMIQDEDKSVGSSVTVNGGGNILKNNGNIGYWIFTQGDGNITVGLTDENITEQHDGIYLEDTGGLTSTSSYDVSIHRSNISGNTNYGINNTISSMVVNATLNWWGADSGPGHVGSGSGDNVSTNVLYDPWLPIDETPPASVTDLVNVSYATNYINWTWTDPADIDFNEVLIYLDGVQIGEVPIGIQLYNATVSPGTYTIGTKTVDERGNINATMKTHTATTVLPLVRFINGTVFESPDPLAGIPDVTVTIGIQTTTTNATGFYSFWVPDGSYSLTATLDPTFYPNSSIPVSTTGEAVVVQDIELELKPTGTISGSVKIG